MRQIKSAGLRLRHNLSSNYVNIRNVPVVENPDGSDLIMCDFRLLMTALNLRKPQIFLDTNKREMESSNKTHAHTP
jgi:hypothetical protein